jgi:hypothetical protein
MTLLFRVLEPQTRKKLLTLRELEPLTCAFLTVLLALVLTRIARKKTCLLERAAQFGVEFDECASDTEANRPSLTRDTAAVSKNQYVETIRHFDRAQSLQNRDPSRFGREIILEGAAIDGDLSRSRPQEHARNASLTAPGPQILLDFLYRQLQIPFLSAITLLNRESSRLLRGVRMFFTRIDF